MRITLIIPQFRAGGAERVMSIMAHHLSQKHEVHLIFHVVHEPFYSIPDRVTVHYVDSVRPHAPFFTKLSGYLGGLARLRRLLQTIEPDVIVSFHAYKYDQVVILANFLRGTPIVVSERTNPLHYGRIGGMVRNAVYRCANAVVVQTDFARGYYERTLKHTKVHTIYNPVSVFPMRQTSRERVILHVGRFTEDKGQAYLIRAFARLNPVDWQLIVVGDGPLASELKSLAVQLGIAEKVIFPGVVKDIGSYLQKASIFVLPSLREGFPNALAEALAAGIPGIAFNCNGGLSELVENGSNGFLVEPKNIEALTERIACLVGDRALREAMGEKARKLAIRFSNSSPIQKWEALLQSLCGSRC